MSSNYDKLLASLTKGAVKTSVREVSKLPSGFNLPTDKADSLGALQSQSANLKTRMEGAGIDPTDFTDSRNPLEKMFNVREGQNWLFDIFEVLNRPQQALFGSMTEVATGGDGGEGFIKGLTGQNRDYTGGGVLRALTTGDSTETGEFDWTDIAGFGLDVFADPADIAFLGAGKVSKGVDAFSNLVKSADKLADSALVMIKESRGAANMYGKAQEAWNAVRMVGGTKAPKGLLDDALIKTNLAVGEVTQDVVAEASEKLVKDVSKLPFGPKGEYFSHFGHNFKMLRTNKAGELVEHAVSPSDIVVRTLVGGFKTAFQASDELLGFAFKSAAGDANVYDKLRKGFISTFDYAKSLPAGALTKIKQAGGNLANFVAFGSAKMEVIKPIIEDAAEKAGATADEVAIIYDRVYNERFLADELQTRSVRDIMESQNIRPYTEQEYNKFLSIVTPAKGQKATDLLPVVELDGRQYIDFTNFKFGSHVELNAKNKAILDEILKTPDILTEAEHAATAEFMARPGMEESFEAWRIHHEDIVGKKGRGLSTLGVQYDQPDGYIKNVAVEDLQQQHIDQYNEFGGTPDKAVKRGEFLGDPAILRQREHGTTTQASNVIFKASVENEGRLFRIDDTNKAFQFNPKGDISKDAAKLIDADGVILNSQTTASINAVLGASTDDIRSAIVGQLEKSAKQVDLAGDEVVGTVQMFVRDGKQFMDFTDLIDSDETYDAFVKAKLESPEDLKKYLEEMHRGDPEAAQRAFDSIGDEYKIKQAVPEAVPETAPVIEPKIVEAPTPIVAPTKVVEPIAPKKAVELGAGDTVLQAKARKQIGYVLDDIKEGKLSDERTYSLVTSGVLPEGQMSTIKLDETILPQKIQDDIAGIRIQKQQLLTKTKEITPAQYKETTQAIREQTKVIGAEIKKALLAVDEAVETVAKVAEPVAPKVFKKVGKPTTILDEDDVYEINEMYDNFIRETSEVEHGDDWSANLIKPNKVEGHNITAKVEEKIREMLDEGDFYTSEENYNALKKLDDEYGFDFTSGQEWDEYRPEVVDEVVETVAKVADEVAPVAKAVEPLTPEELTERLRYGGWNHNTPRYNTGAAVIIDLPEAEAKGYLRISSHMHDSVPVEYITGVVDTQTYIITGDTVSAMNSMRKIPQAEGTVRVVHWTAPGAAKLIQEKGFDLTKYGALESSTDLLEGNTLHSEQVFERMLEDGRIKHGLPTPKPIIAPVKAIEPPVSKVDPMDAVKEKIGKATMEDIETKSIVKNVAEVQINTSAMKDKLIKALEANNVSPEQIAAMTSPEGLAKVNAYMKEVQTKTMSAWADKEAQSLQKVMQLSKDALIEDVRLIDANWVTSFGRQGETAQKYQALVSPAFADLRNVDGSWRADALIRPVPYEKVPGIDALGKPTLTPNKFIKVPSGYDIIDKDEMVKKLTNANQYVKDENITKFVDEIKKWNVEDGPMVIERNAARLLKANPAKDASGILAAADWVNNTFKRFVLLNPGFGVRNLIGISTNLNLAEIGIPEMLTKFGSTSVDLQKYPAILKKFAEMIPLDQEEIRIYNMATDFIGAGFKLPRTFSEVLREGLTGSGSEVQDMENIFKKSLKEGKDLTILDKLEMANAWQNETIDAYGRLTVWQKSIGDGGKDYMARLGVNNPAEAVRLVMFDPNNLSPIERTVMKRLIPFYTFTKMNLVYHMENLPNNAKRYYRLSKVMKAAWTATGLKQEDVDEYKMSAMYIPLPGITKDGKYYTIKANLPQSDLAEWGADPLRRGIASLSPVLKAPVEWVMNQQAFTGAPIENFKGEKSTNLPFLSKKQEYLLNQTGITAPMKSVGSVGELFKGDTGAFLAKASNMGQTGSVGATRISAAYKELEELQEGVKLLKQKGIELPTLAEIQNKDKVLENTSMTLDQLLASFRK